MKKFVFTALLLSTVPSFATTMTDEQKIEVIKQILLKDLPSEGISNFKIRNIDLDLPYRYAVPLVGQAAAVVDHLSFADDVDVDIANIELFHDKVPFRLSCKAVSFRSEVEDHEDENLFAYGMSLKKCKMTNLDTKEKKKLDNEFQKRWDQHN